jgi:hypothetical protein
MMLGGAGSNSWALRHRYVSDPGKRFKSENPAWGSGAFFSKRGDGDLSASTLCLASG